MFQTTNQIFLPFSTKKIGSQSRSIDHPNFHGWSMLISSAFKTYFWLAPSAKSWLGKTIWRPWRPWRPWWKEVQNVGSDDFGAIESENSKVVEPYTRRFPQMGVPPVIIHFHGRFPYEPTSYGDTPMAMETSFWHGMTLERRQHSSMHHLSLQTWNTRWVEILGLIQTCGS